MDKTADEEKTVEIFKRYTADVIHSYKLLTSRYTPLHIDPSAYESSLERTAEHEALRRGMGIIEAERSLRRFVLVGEPGSGKSTALQYLTLHTAQRFYDNPSILDSRPENRSNRAVKPPRIPVLLEMNLYRNREGRNGIRHMIYEQFYSYAFSEDFDTVIEGMLASGSLLIILDGLNECPLAVWEEAVTDIKRFLSRYTNAHIILSCRTRDFPDIFHLSVLSIQPLSAALIDNFIFRALQDTEKKKEKCESLKKLMYSGYPDVIRSPLLLSIAVDVYRGSNWELPDNRGALFRKFFEIWLRRESLKLRKSAATTRIMIMLELAGAVGFFMQNRGEVRTSREAVWGVIRTFLERYIERSVVNREQYTADALLEELLGMGLLVETGRRMKFYHQLFQEFFAGYKLLRDSVEEAVKRLEYAWWEEPLKFYVGMSDNAASVIYESLQKQTVFDAARLLKAGSPARQENELCFAIYRKLCTMLFDKFALNRNRAREYLTGIPDPRIDTLLKRLIKSGESDEAAGIYRSLSDVRNVQKKHKPAHLDGIQYDAAKTGAGKRISEKRFSYGGSLTQIIRRIERLATENTGFLNKDAALYLHQAAAAVGIEAFTNELYRLIQKQPDVNGMLFTAWCLSKISETQAADCVFDALPEDRVNDYLPDAAKWQKNLNKETRFLLNILFNPAVQTVWRLEFAQLDTLSNYAGREQLAKPFGQALQPALDDPEYTGSHLNLLLQTLWDLEPEYAESIMVDWLEKGIDKSYGKTLLLFLSGYGLSDKHFDKGRTLFDRAPAELRLYFPELLAKAAPPRRGMSLLMNLAQNETEPLELRAAAISAMKWHAGIDEIEFLQELVNSDVPGIYDPAYRILDLVKKRIHYDIKIFSAESAEEMALDYLMDEEETFKSPVRARVVVHQDDYKSAIINGARVKFGSVSGRIFFYLAKNSSLGSFHAVGDIRAYLQRQDLYLDETSVRNRIADIRRKIRNALEGRVDPHHLIENTRRFGYRMNASVNVK